jgi:FAD/FMN-containing dehydrogenase
VLPLAEALRVPDLYETFRAVDPGEPGKPAPIEVDVILRSPLSAAELDARVAWVGERISSLVPGASPIEQRRERPDEAVLARFFGGAGEAWTRTRRGRFAPVDVNLGYGAAASAIARAEALLAEQRELPWINLRRALYFAPDFVNFGLHWSLDPARSDDEHALAFVLAGARALAELPVIPYRFGRVWGSALGERLDPGYRTWMHELRRVCDPDGILNPGVSLFGLES